MQDISLERKRDGAYAWHMFEDPDDEGKMIETYLIHSVLELKYRQARVTKADEMIEDRAATIPEGAGRDPLSGRAPARRHCGASWRKRIEPPAGAMRPA